MSAQDFLVAQGFQDPYSYSNPNIPKDYTAIDSFWGKIGQALGFVDRNQYENWKIQQDRIYEREATNSARAWDLWMDSTKYQRLFKDIEAAGYNPWLALQSSGLSTSNTSTAGQGGSARSRSEKSESKLSGVAMLLMGAAKIMSML